ncbi:MAG: class 1 fructose-bisphosphatase [Phycisphaerales bacterium]|nr:class 1 fructose-bisphosphatase [Phycisphaerales bacterium]
MTAKNLTRPIITMIQHVTEAQREFPGASGDLSWILSGIELATRIIQSYVRRAGIGNVLGTLDGTNVQGEVVQKLDVVANETIMRCLGYREIVGIMLSEEDDEPNVVKSPGAGGKYIVLFDPLDGSSNIDVNVSIGTIFSVLRCCEGVPEAKGPMPHILQCGTEQVAAGYVVYGSSTVMVYTTGDGVHLFTLDPSIGTFVLQQENVRMPEKGRTYSVNEAYFATFPVGVQKYLSWAKTKEAGGYGLRYIGSLVADFHRTLLKGGVFLYPPTAKNPEGKLRLLYEANPLAMIAEQAGGVATDFRGRILEKRPEALHERTPLLIGSAGEVARVMKFVS